MPLSKGMIQKLTSTMYFSCSKSTITQKEFKDAVRDWI